MKCQQVTAVGSLDMLVVDADSATGELVRQGAAGFTAGGRVRVASSQDQAQVEMKSRPADVLLVSLHIHDNSGLALIKSLHEKYPRTHIIALSRASEARRRASEKNNACLEAWRAGAADMLIAPFQPADLQRSLAGIFSRRGQLEQLTHRNRRLRQVCKQLNKARHEISQQVDLLCNDLVRAYQEMAQQLNLTQMTVDYCQAAGNEIEVEGLLRKTMEWVLQKLGPINAAVYLSDAEHRFALGAYLNLDTEADAELINTVGETIIKQTEGSSHALAIDDDQSIDELFGENGARLKGRSWLSAACYTANAQKRDCLAVLVLFRSQGDGGGGGAGAAGGFDPNVRGMLEAVSPVLGEKIEQALELYHRMHPDGDDDAAQEFEQ
jgi:response regulator of citrate/malate metabolism